MSDLISKQTAIDEWKNDFKGYVNMLNIPRDDYNGIMEYIDELPSAQPDHFADSNKKGVSCEDAVSKADVLETYADLYDVFEDNKQISKELHKVYDKLNALPSAQSEIIHCKDCKWKQGFECVRFSDVMPFPDDFCSRAERRADETD